MRQKDKITNFYGHEKEYSIDAAWINQDGGLTLHLNVDHRETAEEIEINYLACLTLCDYLNKHFPY